MLLARNLVAGLTNSAWSMVVTLVTVPIYLHYLGVEAYGLIGFYIFSQSILQLLDMGLSPTINREVARCTSVGNLGSAAILLRTLAVVYWIVGGGILISFYFVAPYIASIWLNADGLSVETISSSMVLIGVVIASRWPLGLYQGVLIGAEKLVISSFIGVSMTTIASVGSVIVLAFVSRTIQAFFLWQAVVGLVYSIVMGLAAWRVVGREGHHGFSWQRLKEVWKFSAGMGFVAITAIILMQVDKVVLTRMLSLSDFGQYMLAVLISSGLFVLIRPLFNIIFPRMSALIARKNYVELGEIYSLGTRVLCITLFPVAVAVATFSFDIVWVWTQDAGIARSIAPMVSLLLMGTALNGVMHFPYALQLASGLTRLPILINCILISAFLPVVILLTREYGALGAASSWALMNLLYFFLGTWLTHRELLREQGMKWLVIDVLCPLAISILVIACGGKLVQEAGYGVVVNLIAAVLLAFSAFLINLLLISNVESRLRKVIGSL